MKMVLLITAQVEQGMDVALAWQEAGAPGVTIFRTHGLRTLQEKAKTGSVELPLVLSSMASAMAHIITRMEAPGEMLLSVVPDEMVDMLEKEAAKVLGDLTEPYSGIMLVIDIERAIGVRHHTEQSKKGK